ALASAYSSSGRTLGGAVHLEDDPAPRPRGASPGRCHPNPYPAGGTHGVSNRSVLPSGSRPAIPRASRRDHGTPSGVDVLGPRGRGSSPRYPQTRRLRHGELRSRPLERTHEGEEWGGGGDGDSLRRSARLSPTAA